MKRRDATPREVRDANRRLYDAVAGRYEEIDRRRSPTLERWLRSRLAALRDRAPGGCLLDLGAGSGLVARCAEGLFDPRVGLDVSARILAVHRESFDLAVVGDAACLPFADGSFDAVVCFAVLHHLYAFEGLVAEVARVLRAGGVFYSDHDMDLCFRRRFRLPLFVYRKLRNAKAKYRRASREVSGDLYDLSEWQEEGVDSGKLTRLFEEAGCRVEARYHWFGLSSLSDKLLGPKPRRRGWAPLASLVAVKGGSARG
ncbi:MAG TPA: class I SAM-dependent methyltransferase [Planctomycetota bacterium]|nr:class I SAM-dependent methyltransferase [Planctomycetota bacterium]